MTPEKRHPTVVQDPPTIDDDDLREPTKEEIMEDIRVGLRDVIADKEMIPAREGLEAIRRRIYGDGNQS